MRLIERRWASSGHVTYLAQSAGLLKRWSRCFDVHVGNQEANRWCRESTVTCYGPAVATWTTYLTELDGEKPRRNQRGVFVGVEAENFVSHPRTTVFGQEPTTEVNDGQVLASPV